MLNVSGKFCPQITVGKASCLILLDAHWKDANNMTFNVLYDWTECLNERSICFKTWRIFRELELNCSLKKKKQVIYYCSKILHIEVPFMFSVFNSISFDIIMQGQKENKNIQYTTCINHVPLFIWDNSRGRFFT